MPGISIRFSRFVQNVSYKSLLLIILFTSVFTHLFFCIHAVKLPKWNTLSQSLTHPHTSAQTRAHTVAHTQAHTHSSTSTHTQSQQLLAKWLPLHSTTTQNCQGSNWHTGHKKLTEQGAEQDCELSLPGSREESN